MRKDDFIKRGPVLPEKETLTEVLEERKPNRISLADRLKGNGKALLPPKEEEEEPTKPFRETKTTTEEEGPEKEKDAEGTDSDKETDPEKEDSFDEFADKIEDSLEDGDAKEIAEWIVQFGNIGRIIFLPGVYEGFMYPGQERNDIRDVHRRAIQNKKESKDPETGFNDYDKELWAKWPLLQEAIKDVSFTEPEIKTFAKYLAREIAEVTVSVWMKKHMWLLYWLYLEAKHSKNIIGARAIGAFNKKFTGKK